MTDAEKLDAIARVVARNEAEIEAEHGNKWLRDSDIALEAIGAILNGCPQDSIVRQFLDEGDGDERA
jgi:hypothetical protein